MQGNRAANWRFVRHFAPPGAVRPNGTHGPPWEKAQCLSYRLTAGMGKVGALLDVSRRPAFSLGAWQGGAWTTVLPSTASCGRRGDGIPGRWPKKAQQPFNPLVDEWTQGPGRGGVVQDAFGELFGGHCAFPSIVRLGTQ